MQFAFLANSTAALQAYQRAWGVGAVSAGRDELGQNSRACAKPPSSWRRCSPASAGRPAGARAEQAEASPRGKQTYKWVDDKGVTHYGDSVPAEYSQREQRVLNSQGVEVQKRQAEMTPTEAAEYAAQAEGRSAPQAARHVPDLHLPVGQGNRERARRAARPDQRPDHRGRGVHLEPHHARRRPQAARACIFAPYNTKPGARRMPDDLAEEMVRALSELRTQNSALAAKRDRACRTSSTQFDARHQAVQGTAHLGRRAPQRGEPRQEAVVSVQRVPVWPKPPAPRGLAAKSSTTSSRTCTTGTMTICAMRSPGCTVKSVAPRFQHDTMSCPW